MKGFSKASAVLLGLVVLGCASGNKEEARSGAHILALGTYEASIGTPVDVFGTGFPTPDEGELYLVFDGTWTDDQGSQSQVYEEFLLKRENAGHARWTTFGPYKIPFGTGDRPGTFTGKVSTQIHSRDGYTVAEDPEPQDVVFDIEPSVIVHELQPLSANCGGPIKRGIGGLPYRMRVEAVGFEPETFTYSIETPEIDVPFRSIRRLATGRFDELGIDGDFVLPPVPNDMQFYGAIMVVQATDKDGRSVSNSFALGVRRPLEVYYNGNVATAEFYAPEPQTSCIPGGANGRDLTWENTREEEASRSYNIDWDQNWLSTHTVETGTSRTVGASVVNGIGFATTNSVDFSWGTQSEVNGTVGLDTLIKVGIGGRRNYLRDQGTSSSTTNEQSRQEGIEVSETTTETESVAESMGGSVGEGYSNTVSSVDSIGKSFSGQIIAGTYGVLYTQKSRLLRRGAIVTYNQCGAADVIGDVDFNDWSWAIDLKLGNECTPLPKSNLPAAQCLIGECAGEL